SLVRGLLGARARDQAIARAGARGLSRWRQAGPDGAVSQPFGGLVHPAPGTRDPGGAGPQGRRTLAPVVSLLPRGTDRLPARRRGEAQRGVAGGGAGAGAGGGGDEAVEPAPLS